MPWCPCSCQGINTHAQTDCMVMSLTHSVQQPPDCPPVLPSGLLSLHLMTLPLFLASLCLMKTVCKFLQIYVPILSKLISRLYSVSLFFPSWRMASSYLSFLKQISSPVPEYLYKHILSPCRAQTSGALSGRFRVELPNSPHS